MRYKNTTEGRRRVLPQAGMAFVLAASTFLAPALLGPTAALADQGCNSSGNKPQKCLDLDLDGFTPNDGDCDDADPLVFPGAIEILNGIDDDCDGLIDEGIISFPFFDMDGDGFDVIPFGPDCNDFDSSIYPGAIEMLNGIDDDCDGLIDEGIIIIPISDVDGDGFDRIPLGFDCDDLDPTINPGAFDVPGDGIDQDCDGFDAVTPDPDADGDGVTVGDGDCDDADPNNFPGNTEVFDGVDNNCDGVADEGFDLDGDGVTVGDGDCDDADPNNFPGNTEVFDGVDNNCDGVADEGFDLDGDGVTVGDGDCDDADPNNFPGNTEVFDGVDNNCDGVADEGFPPVDDCLINLDINFTATVRPDGPTDCGTPKPCRLRLIEGINFDAAEHTEEPIVCESPTPNPTPVPPRPPAPAPEVGGVSLARTSPLCPDGEVPFAGFTDTDADLAIDCLAWLDIVQGFEDGSFVPGRDVTVGQGATMIVGMLRVAGVTPDASVTDHYTDDNDSTHQGALNLLADLGILSGTDGVSGHAQSLTGEQFAAMVRAALALVPDVALDDETIADNVAALASMGVTVDLTAFVTRRDATEVIRVLLERWYALSPAAV